MSEIDGKGRKSGLSPRELYEKYKGFEVIAGYGCHGIIAGYIENLCEDEYILIASVPKDEGWDWLYEGDIIPDYKGEERERSFLYVQEEGIVK